MFRESEGILYHIGEFLHPFSKSVKIQGIFLGSGKLFCCIFCVRFKC